MLGLHPGARHPEVKRLQRIVTVERIGIDRAERESSTFGSSTLAGLHALQIRNDIAVRDDVDAETNEWLVSLERKLTYAYGDTFTSGRPFRDWVEAVSEDFYGIVHGQLFSTDGGPPDMRFRSATQHTVVLSNRQPGEPDEWMALGGTNKSARFALSYARRRSYDIVVRVCAPFELSLGALAESQLVRSVPPEVFVEVLVPPPDETEPANQKRLSRLRSPARRPLAAAPIPDDTVQEPPELGTPTEWDRGWADDS